MCACVLSYVRLFGTPWTVAHQTPLPTRFSRQDHWSELPFSPPVDLPDPGIEPESPVFSSLQVNSLPLSYLGSQAYEQKTFLTVLEAGGPSFGCNMVRFW